MAITVYTYNDKVLKNVATDKWLKKKDPFIMNASNAILTQSGDYYWAAWESPAYPSGYDGGGKQYIVVNNNSAEDTTERNPTNFMYASVTNNGGPSAINSAIIQTHGTSTGTLTSNPVSSYGSYLTISVKGTEEQTRAYLANLTITILD